MKGQTGASLTVILIRTAAQRQCDYSRVKEKQKQLTQFSNTRRSTEINLDNIRSNKITCNYLK